MDVTLLSAVDQLALVGRKEVSAVELLDAALARYERHNPEVNAVVVTQLDAARERATEVDEATARGESLGPLHGLPMTIKEPFDWVGTASTAGREQLVDHRPEANSVAVQRLIDAGAVIWGKSNTPVSMADWQTFNPLFGTTNNPWDLTRVPGGSSGGAAAAVATGMTALEMGSDIGASIRNPAHYCGIFGHKPTFGIVPIEGHGHPGSPVEIDIGVAGPLARTAADCQLGLSVLAGAAGLAQRGWRLDLPAPRNVTLSDYRVAVMLESPCVIQDSELTDQLAATVDALAAAGVEVHHGARPDIDIERAYEVYLLLLRASTGGSGPEEVYRANLAHAARWDAGDRDYRAISGKGITLSHWEWCQLHDERERHRLAWDAFFGEYDLMLSPIAASAAFPHDHVGERADRTIPVNGGQESTIDQLFWAGYSCNVYLPATVAPAGLTRSGLPCGLQIVAPHLGDLESLHFASLMERELGGYQPPPVVTGDAPVTRNTAVAGTATEGR